MQKKIQLQKDIYIYIIAPMQKEIYSYFETVLSSPPSLSIVSWVSILQLQRLSSSPHNLTPCSVIKKLKGLVIVSKFDSGNPVFYILVLNKFHYFQKLKIL